MQAATISSRGVRESPKPRRDVYKRQLFIHQKDTPGVVAHIASSLAPYQINIAFMRLYRESKGENAYTVIEADNPVPRAVCDQITAHENIVSATVIPL